MVLHLCRLRAANARPACCEDAGAHTDQASMTDTCAQGVAPRSWSCNRTMILFRCHEPAPHSVEHERLNPDAPVLCVMLFLACLCHSHRVCATPVKHERCRSEVWQRRSHFTATFVIRQAGAHQASSGHAAVHCAAVAPEQAFSCRCCQCESFAVSMLPTFDC